MCLKIDFEKTEQWKKILKAHKGWIQVWKSFDIETRVGELCSAYRYVTAKPGWNVSDRQNVEMQSFEKGKGYISSGSHVFLDPVTYASKSQWTNNIMVPVYVKAKDLVAVGFFADTLTAVFMKYYFYRNDYDNAMNGKCIKMTRPKM